MPQFVIKAQVMLEAVENWRCKSLCLKRKAIESGQNILGMQLITPQTGESGQKVRKVMVAEALDIAVNIILQLH